jgi:Rieske Fe-S protein
MVAGLAGGYGGFGAIALRYLYPSTTGDRIWQFVIETDRVKVGESIRYRGPSGETVNIARQNRNGDAEDFIALSSTCPHLGCQVRWESQNNRFYCPCHNGVFDPAGVATSGPPACQVRWESQNNRFYCPCHNGVFDPAGVATSGPPAEAGQSLSRYPLQVTNGLLHIAVPPPQYGVREVKGEILAADADISGPGHDPCLSCSPAPPREETRKQEV